MSKVIKRRWRSDIGGLGLPRRATRSCDYEAYVPDPLIGRTFAFDGDVAADIADAEAAISRMNVEATALVDTEALARILLRAEAVASSRIEGLEVGAQTSAASRGRARDCTSPPPTSPPQRCSATSTRSSTVSSASGWARRSPWTCCSEIHRRLLRGTHLDSLRRRMCARPKTGSAAATTTPALPRTFPRRPSTSRNSLGDLCAFCNTDELPAVAQAAIAHAQFETIHPFVDGNGRTGRALIHLVLRRRGLTPRALPPVSLVLATWARTYIEGLVDYRHIGSPTSRKAIEGVNDWVAAFSSACTRCASDATTFQARAEQLEAGVARAAGQNSRQLGNRPTAAPSAGSANPHGAQRGSPDRPHVQANTHCD